ncbi:DUF669 domain-containing protein [Pediococcus pentosaceus]|uniref:DUF669 domain-containing protein n=1 Tax=Pediococcus pentosaceus TaxID=1255 RepID=UPI003982237C
MAFTFNKDDIRTASTGLEFGGDYNVVITSAEFKGKSKNGNDYATIHFEVADGEQKGGRITHNLVDDYESDNPFNYRVINSMLTAMNFQINDNTQLELKTLAPRLINQKLAVRVTKFEKYTNDEGKVFYNPRVESFGTWMAAGSQVDKSNPRPSVGKQHNASQTFSNGTPLPPDPMAGQATDNPFGG